MKAKQYIYTSWKNGDLADKGFMIYSKSKGITEKECSDIKFVMQYTPPHDLPPAPSIDQINRDFPYSFAFFRLSSGNLCVAQSTYIGKDYSGRYGNYIIHALIFDENELKIYPCELFGEEYIKLNLTQEELNAIPPIPDLPELEVKSYSNIINDELIMDFISEREYKFSYFLSALLKGKTENIPVYINDTREHLVLWLAAVHRVFPIQTAKKISFNTYVHEHKKFNTDACKEKGLSLDCIGVRPDVNYFNYSNGVKASNQIVLDFIGNYITDGINIPNFIKELSSSYLTGMDEINAFIDFLGLIEFYYFSDELEIAHKFFKLYIMNDLQNLDDMAQIISFGDRFCPEHVNAEVGAKIADIISGDNLNNIKICEKVFPYLYKYAFFMKFTIHDNLYKSMLYFANKKDESNIFFKILNNIKVKFPDKFEDFLRFLYSEDIINNCKLNLSFSKNANFPLFFSEFIIRYYKESCSIAGENLVLHLLGRCIMQLCKLDDSEKSALEIAGVCKEDKELLLLILSAFIQSFTSRQKQNFCREFTSYLTSLGDKEKNIIQDYLMDDVMTAGICAYIAAQDIQRAKNPLMAFWKLYDEKFKLSEYFEKIDLGPMVSAALSKANSFKNLLKLICELPSNCIKDVEVCDIVAEKLASGGLKTLLKLDSDIAIKAFNLCKSSKSTQAKLVACVVLLKLIQSESEQNAVYPSFADIYSKNFSSYDLYDLENREYELYLSNAVPVFIMCMYDGVDLEKIVTFCANEEKVDILCKNIAQCMKKLKKKSYNKYERILNLINDYVKENTENNKIKIFSQLILKYLDKL